MGEPAAPSGNEFSRDVDIHRCILALEKEADVVNVDSEVNIDSLN